MLVRAESLKKQYDQSFIDEVGRGIKASEKRGCYTAIVGKHVCDTATLGELKKQLWANGYNLESSYNSHSVDTLKITW